MIKKLFYIVIFYGLFSSTYAFAQKNVTEAVNNPSRPDTDVIRDTNRRPARVLSFLGIKPGMTVLDVYSTEGYYTEILSYAVGKKGKVFAHNSKAYRKFYGKSINERFVGGRLNNVEKIYAHPREIKLQNNQLDMALMILIYHDLYVTNARNLIKPADRHNLIKQVYKSLKPGGILGIVDHVAPRGSGVEVATKWHRLSATIVTKELTDYGFEFLDENTSLRNRTDPHNISIFDKSVRRKTDRYILKFRKPLTDRVTVK